MKQCRIKIAEELFNIFIIYYIANILQLYLQITSVGDDDFITSSTCDDAKEKQLVHTTMSQQQLFTFYFPFFLTRKVEFGLLSEFNLLWIGILKSMTLQYHLDSLLITLGRIGKQPPELKLVRGGTGYN